jgi:hypothetical protein
MRQENPSISKSYHNSETKPYGKYKQAIKLLEASKDTLRIVYVTKFVYLLFQRSHHIELNRIKMVDLKD